MEFFSNWKDILIDWGNEYNIRGFPSNKKDLDNLEKISFYHFEYAFMDYKRIYNLPNEICKLKNLKILFIGHKSANDMIQCELTKLPDCIGNLQNLEELHLSNQYDIKELPKSIGKLTKLKKLIMCNIDIQLPDEIINLKNLKEIELPVFFEPTKKQKKWLEELKNNGCDITDSEFESNDIDDENENTNNEDDNDTYIDAESSDEEIIDFFGIKYIYHMTHYSNLEGILKNGLLSHNNKFVNQHIDNEEVNDRRDKIEPINHYNLHSYVPFYFNPKNPMLYVNKDIQEDIIILAFDVNLMSEKYSIFTDGNAASSKTNFFNDIDDLWDLNWESIFSDYWNDYEDGKREVMAEALVHNNVDISHLKKIYCFDEATEAYILDLDDKLDVEIDKEKYFN